MAGAAPAKKTQKEVQSRRGIWLSSTGTISFGNGVINEILIDEAIFDEIKGKSTEDRIKQYDLIKSPPPPPAAVETQAPAEAPPAAQESVVGPVTADPVRAEEEHPVQG